MPSMAWKTCRRALIALESSLCDGEGHCDAVKLAGLAVREAAYVYPDWKTMPDGRLWRLIERFFDMVWADACTILSRFETVLAIQSPRRAQTTHPSCLVGRCTGCVELTPRPRAVDPLAFVGMPGCRRPSRPYDPRHPDLPLRPQKMEVTSEASPA